MSASLQAERHGTHDVHCDGALEQCALACLVRLDSDLSPTSSLCFFYVFLERYIILINPRGLTLPPLLDRSQKEQSSDFQATLALRNSRILPLVVRFSHWLGFAIRVYGLNQAPLLSSFLRPLFFCLMFLVSSLNYKSREIKFHSFSIY